MFVKSSQLGRGTRSVYEIFKRSYNMKKLSEQAEKNPQVKHLFEKQSKRKERQGTLAKLVEKRTTEYKEYFPQSSDPSIIKRPRHTSYDHIGQKRAVHLSKILRAFLTDRIGSGEIGDTLAGKDFQLTNIVVPVDLNRIEVLWWSPEHEAKTIEDLLQTAGEQLRTAIRHAQLLPNLPPVIFKRDNLRSERDQIHHLLDTVDTGTSSEIVPVDPPERNDLYDSDRTVILQKLSTQASVTEEENVDVNRLSAEQLQRRMKAFALTKSMKRVQEQRDAMFGIMAVEKERQNREHFSIDDMTDDERVHELK